MVHEFKITHELVAQKVLLDCYASLFFRFFKKRLAVENLSLIRVLMRDLIVVDELS
jgi:hypothetical protein